jgi:hypothetical protein
MGNENMKTVLLIKTSGSFQIGDRRSTVDYIMFLIISTLIPMVIIPRIPFNFT